MKVDSSEYKEVLPTPVHARQFSAMGLFHSTVEELGWGRGAIFTCDCASMLRPATNCTPWQVAEAFHATCPELAFSILSIQVRRAPTDVPGACARAGLTLLHGSPLSAAREQPGPEAWEAAKCWHDACHLVRDALTHASPKRSEACIPVSPRSGWRNRCSGRCTRSTRPRWGEDTTRMRSFSSMGYFQALPDTEIGGLFSS